MSKKKIFTEIFCNIIFLKNPELPQMFENQMLFLRYEN